MVGLAAWRRRALTGAAWRRRLGGGPHPCLARAQAAAFVPRDVEAGVYAWWEGWRPAPAPAGAGAAAVEFSVVLPPPNVTGQLHIGHALTVTIQDALVRWHAMRGERVVWVPGVDHAGIATQSVVERRLERERGLTRHALGRAAFLAEVWRWYESYRGRIEEQLRRLGARLDWPLAAFTMDAPRSAAVARSFVALHRRGLVFRAERMVHWCPHLRTVLSDLEVDSEELAGPTSLRLPGQAAPVELGVLYELAYPVLGPAGGLAGADAGEVVVATTRPETLLGDAAVAVHPADARHAWLHGRSLRHPLLAGRTLPVLVDAELVDPAVGTGAVKVSPAHDEADWACALRHGLPVAPLRVIDDAGRMTRAAGPEFAGLDRFAARQKVLARLDELGLLRGRRAHAMRVARCSRSGDLLEPMLKPQWFVRCAPLVEVAQRAVASGALPIAPEWHTKTWQHFMDGARDWCVSRQLWWGHRVPAWRLAARQQQAHSNSPRGGEQPHEQPHEQAHEQVWFVAEDESGARAEAARALGLDAAGAGALELEQDEDVLDTWFSSALFPLTALGWRGPAALEGPVLGERAPPGYPLSLMETGSDILFFWVARMVFLCAELGPRDWAADAGGAARLLPFRRVFLHPIVRDKQGRKMSKSLGNVIDPLQVIEGCEPARLAEGLRAGNLDPRELERALAAQTKELPEGIPACGADALRLALASYCNHGAAINLDLERVVTWRSFCNKLWNAVRFVLAQEPADGAGAGGGGPANGVAAPQLLETRWVLSRLAHCVAAVDAGLGTVELDKVTQALHDFVVATLCDVFVETSKPAVWGGAAPARRAETLAALVECLDVSLRLMHPLAPFVTEELWQRLAASPHAASLRQGTHTGAGEGAVGPLVARRFPAPAEWAARVDEAAEAQMGLALDCAHAARALQDKLKGVLDGGQPALQIVLDAAAPARDLLVGQPEAQQLVLRLSRASRLDVLSATEERAALPGLEQAVRPGLAVRLLVEVRAGERERIAAELNRLAKRMDKEKKLEAKLTSMLGSQKYLDKAPPHVVDKDREYLQEAQLAIASTAASIALFQRLLQSQ